MKIERTVLTIYCTAGQPSHPSWSWLQNNDGAFYDGNV
jgi:hypothetical protein